jgi:hypothetical protein
VDNAGEHPENGRESALFRFRAPVGRAIHHEKCATNVMGVYNRDAPDQAG